MSKPAVPSWHVPVRLDEVPADGREFVIEADAGAREAVAREASLIGLPRLQARFDLQRRGDDALHVRGQVSATVEQTCGVTLEPLRNEVNEAVDLVFSAHVEDRRDEANENELHEGPEPLVNGAVDLGALAIEFLIIGVDPFPRKPGVEFASRVTEDAGSSNPFAVLAGLKDGNGRKD